MTEKYVRKIGNDNFKNVAQSRDSDRLTLFVCVCVLRAHIDLYGKIHARFFEREAMLASPNNTEGTISMLQGSTPVAVHKYIRGVSLFQVNPFFVHMTTGKPMELLFNSIMASTLAKNLDFENDMVRCSKQANKFRAQPPLMMQKPPDRGGGGGGGGAQEVMASEGLGSVGYNRFGLHGNGSDFQDGMGKSAIHDSAVREKVLVQIQQYLKIHEMHKYAAAATAVAPPSSSSSSSSSASNSFLSERIEVPMGQQFVSHVHPESPAETLVKYATINTETVFNAFGVPLSMVSQKSSLGGQNTMNENANVIFQMTIQRIRSQLMILFKHMYDQIFYEHHVIQYIIDNKGKSEGAAEAAEAVISMPGNIDPGVMEILFKEKILKYDAYRNYLSETYALPLANLEEDESKLTQSEEAQALKDKSQPSSAKKRK